MKDYIVIATAANHQIRAYAATTKEMVEKARQVHHTSPVASAALGRTLTAGAIMGSMLKGETDIITLQIRGDGPLKGLVVTADSKSNVKGYVYEPEVDLPLNKIGKLDVSKALGNGILSVIKDIGLKEPYIGQTHLVSGEIAEDLTYYFANSEQVPSSVGLGVLVDVDYSIKQAGGFIIQLLPDAEEEVIQALEKNLGEMKSITTLLEEGKKPEEILKIILKDMNLQVLHRVKPQFYCNCDKERVEKALVSIGKKDLLEMIEEGKPIELNCHFCNEKYEFSVGELEKLVWEISR